MKRQARLCCSDLTGRHVKYEQAFGLGTLLGTVQEEYPDPDRVGLEILLKVRFFNGEPWPFDPPKHLVDVIEGDHK